MPVQAAAALSRQSRHDRRIGRAEAVIPHGDYCYRITSVATGADGAPSLKTQCCPYWKGRKDRPEQRFGYCRLLKVGDYTHGRTPDGKPRATSLLWDQVKECGLNSEPVAISS
ncbi:hypothetical protein [Microvirga yunnanensis]|uniref:hypothetical protein n=1 Tax=Microvirga yunnanensis TaxID=2953740 RepID=UPI0021CADC8C|nr:hypothetical protein [Microvirga sp. HBU65207]